MGYPMFRHVHYLGRVWKKKTTNQNDGIWINEWDIDGDVQWRHIKIYKAILWYWGSPWMLFNSQWYYTHDPTLLRLRSIKLYHQDVPIIMMIRPLWWLNPHWTHIALFKTALPSTWFTIWPHDGSVCHINGLPLTINKNPSHVNAYIYIIYIPLTYGSVMGTMIHLAVFWLKNQRFSHPAGPMGPMGRWLEAEQKLAAMGRLHFRWPEMTGAFQLVMWVPPVIIHV